MSNLSDIVQGGGGEVLDPSKFVFTEAELDAEIAAGSTSIVVAAPITITSSKTLSTANVRISSKSKEAVLTDDGSLTAPLFTIDAQNVSLFGLSIQCDSNIFNVIDLTANASKCEISNCTIKTDVIDVIHLNEVSSNNVISDNVIEQINLSSTFTQKGPVGGIPEVLNSAALGSEGLNSFGWDSDISADGKIMVVSGLGYFGNSDPNLTDRSAAQVFKLNETNQWEPLGQEFIGANLSEYEFEFVKINAEGNRVVFLQEGTVADITIYDLNETTDPPQWELNTSTFTNPTTQLETTGIIQDVPAYRVAMDINDQGTIIGALDYDGVVTIYEESNGAWVQKGSAITGTAQDFYGSYHNIKSDSSGNTFLIGYKSDGSADAKRGGAEVITYNGNDWITKGTPILGLIDGIQIGASNQIFDASSGISGDGNTIALQAEIKLQGFEDINTSFAGADKEQFIKTYNFKNFNDIADFKNVLPVDVFNTIFNRNDDRTNIIVHLIYKYDETLMNWKLLDIVTLKTSLNDFLTIKSFANNLTRRYNYNLGLNYNGSVFCVNNSQAQLTVYQLNTKTKTYEQSSRLQGLELDFSNYAATAEDFETDHLAVNGISKNGKHFYSSTPFASITFAVVFDVGVKPNILDFGINNKLAGNSFEKEEKIQSTKEIRNWNSYSIGIYKDPFSGVSATNLNITRFLGSYDEVFASNAAGIFKCPEPEAGARFRIFVMDTVAPYSTGLNAIVIEPFDTELIIDAGQPYDSSSPNGGFTLTPGASYEFVSDGTNWFTLKT